MTKKILDVRDLGYAILRDSQSGGKKKKELIAFAKKSGFDFKDPEITKRVKGWLNIYLEV